MTLVVRTPLAWLGPGRITPDVQITCEGDTITGVGPVRPVPDEARVIAVDGFCMPAGADRHVHAELGDTVVMLRRGVTAVRDLAWPPDRIFPLAEASELPGFHGPLIRAVGPMLTAAGGYPTKATWAPAGTGLEVADADDAAGAVAALGQRGATAIKVSLNAQAGPTPTDAVLMAVCDAAHGLDLPVTAHAEGAGQVSRALGAGIDELAHTPWTERLSDDVIAAAAARMRWITTLDIHGFGRDSEALRIATDNLARFHRAGGSVHYGTDLGNGAIPSGIHTRELRLMHEAGMAIEQVLASLVRAPLQPGAPADLLVLGDSALGDVGALDDIRLVVKGGALVAGTDH